MRVGHNPEKDKLKNPLGFFHQVVIPVYIPKTEGYFARSLEILKLCLESLILTCHEKTFITVVNNGSCAEVAEYLNSMIKQQKIHELIQTDSIGKLNSVLKGIVGHDFSFVTVTDADVLFMNKWQNASYDIFESMPKAGVVCTTPSSKSYRSLVSNLYWDKFFSNNLGFCKVKNPKAMKAFANSIGNSEFYNQSHLDSYLTISINDTNAVVGAGHFVATYRGDIFNDLAQTHSEYSLGANSEHDLLDLPVVKKGYWRLSTEDNFTFHMGNIVEPWMTETIQTLTVNTEKTKLPRLSDDRNYNKIGYAIKNRYFRKFIMHKWVLRKFLIWKGLNKNSAKKYLTW